MKRILLIKAIVLSCFSFGQKQIESPKEYYLKNKKTADSIGIDYYEVKIPLQKIENLTDFKDRLLISESYKDKEKTKAILEEFYYYIPQNIDYKKVTSTEEHILGFYKEQETKFYIEAYRIIRGKIVEYYKAKIKELEENLIYNLRKANYPIEKFNKLSDEEKNNIIEKINSGYIFP